MIKEHDRIVLKVAISDEGLEAGDVGTIVHIYHDGLAYEVEFTTLTGTTAVWLRSKLHKSARFTSGRSHTRDNCK